MNAYELTWTEGPIANGGYVSIHDLGTDKIRRELVILDDEGGMVTIKNEDIGKLYRMLKPNLAG